MPTDISNYPTSALSKAKLQRTYRRQQAFIIHFRGHVAITKQGTLAAKKDIKKQFSQTKNKSLAKLFPLFSVACEK